MAKKVLVTGGAGFIGSHLVEELLKRGYFVRVLDNFSSGKMRNLEFTKDEGRRTRYELIRGDIKNKNVCLSACRNIDYVLHQAALRSVPKSMQSPAEYNEVNIQGTLNLLQAARDKKVKNFVFASSSSVYGEIEKFPQRENSLPGPISPYALTKLAGEHYCRMFSLHHKLPTVSLRYFNVFGPRQSLDDEYAVVIPKFISCFIQGKRPPVFGTGRQSRDFCYVGNVVQANLLAMQKPGAKGEVYNVAGGRDYSILELVAILNRLTKKKLRPKLFAPRSGDVFRTWADLSKVKKELGYRPQVDFTRGLKITKEYFEKNT